MTKDRDPVTIENTLYRVLGVITIERAAAVTSRSESYLRALSDPDKRERLTIEDAIALDLEHRAQGGLGFPLFETYGRIVEAESAARFADAAAIGAIAVDVARESGQAVSALIAAQLPGADRKTIELALRECEEADATIDAAIPILRQKLAHPPDTS